MCSAAQRLRLARSLVYVIKLMLAALYIAKTSAPSPTSRLWSYMESKSDWMMTCLDYITEKEEDIVILEQSIHQCIKSNNINVTTRHGNHKCFQNSKQDVYISASVIETL